MTSISGKTIQKGIVGSKIVKNKLSIARNQQNITTFVSKIAKYAKNIVEFVKKINNFT